MSVRDITITSLETITAFDLIDGSYKFTLDELQSATLAQAQEKTEITGRAGRKLSSLKRNKSVTVSGTNGLLSTGLLELQTGVAFKEDSTEVMWTDYITVSEKDVGTQSNPDMVPTATTKYKAVGTTGSEIEDIYVRNDDGTLGKALTQKATLNMEDKEVVYEEDGETIKEEAVIADTLSFTYDPSTKELLFSSDIVKGTELVAYYKRKITASSLKNDSATYSGKCTIYIDAIGEDICGKIYRLQICIPKADFSGDFSLEFGGDQSVHAFEAEALSGACGTSGELFTYVIFGEETPDAA